MKCPICKKEIKTYSASPSLEKHIIGKARNEALLNMLNLYKYHTRNFKNVSRIVMLKQMPHFNWVRKNNKQ